MMVFFLWILWIWLLIVVYTDIFRRDDIGGGAKTLWVIFTLFLPFLGTFVYLISQGKGMRERQEQDARNSKSQMDAYVRSVARESGSSSAEQIARAKELLDTGAITPAEFEQLKQKALAAA